MVDECTEFILKYSFSAVPSDFGREEISILSQNGCCVERRYAIIGEKKTKEIKKLF